MGCRSLFIVYFFEYNMRNSRDNIIKILESFNNIKSKDSRINEDFDSFKTEEELLKSLVGEYHYKNYTIYANSIVYKSGIEWNPIKAFGNFVQWLYHPLNC